MPLSAMLFLEVGILATQRVKSGKEAGVEERGGRTGRGSPGRNRERRGEGGSLEGEEEGGGRRRGIRAN